MKTKNSIRQTLSLASVSTCVAAFALSTLTFAASAGTASGGGGSDVVAEFVTRAESLLARLKTTHPETKEVEDLQVLLKSNKLKILPVGVLKDLANGKDIPDQDALLAYGLPGNIQLRTAVWDEAFRSKRNMDHHIFHELCRAAAPKCNDEAYRISIVQLQLAPSSYAPVFQPTSTAEEIMKLSIGTANEAGIKKAIAMGYKINKSLRTHGGTDFSSSELLPPLAYAAEIGNDRSIEILIQLGAEINYVDTFGMTAMHRAAAFDHPSSIRYLASKGADLDPRALKYDGVTQKPLGAPNSPTPLMSTIYSSAIESAKVLLELGAKIEYAGGTGSDQIDSPLGKAIEKQKIAFVKLFVSHEADVNKQFWGCWTPLICAANIGNLEIAKYLIQSGANVNHVDVMPIPTMSPVLTTALMVTKTGAMVRLLVTSGADVQYSTPQGRNALISAAFTGNVELIRTLVEAGVPVNQVMTEHSSLPPSTALDITISKDYVDAIRYLRSVGAKRVSELN